MPDILFRVFIHDHFAKESYSYKAWAETIEEMTERANRNLHGGESLESVEECSFSEDDEISK